MNPPDPIRIISFGHNHSRPPAVERTVDIRHALFEPTSDLLDLDGRDQRVQAFVFNTRGATELIGELVGYTEGLPLAEPRRIAIGSVDGKHRAPALAELIATALRARGHEVVVEHLHLEP